MDPNKCRPFEEFWRDIQCLIGRHVKNKQWHAPQCDKTKRGEKYRTADTTRTWTEPSSCTAPIISMTFPGTNSKSGDTKTWILPPSTHSNSTIESPSKLTGMPTTLAMQLTYSPERIMEAFTRGKAPSGRDMMIKCWCSRRRATGITRGVMSLQQIRDDVVYVAVWRNRRLIQWGSRKKRISYKFEFLRR